MLQAAAFQLGDGKTIATIDADGVALAAIQGLHALLQEKTAALEGLRDEKAEVRRAASDALGFGGARRPKHPDVIDPLIAALEDSDRTTRRNAARALHFRPAVRAIEPLIGRLDDKGDVKEAASKALAYLTGQKLGEDAAAWQSWWRQNGATFELPRHLRPR